MKKRILAVVLVLAMTVSSLCITKPEAKEVKAAEPVSNTDMLGIKMQTRQNTDGTTDLRIVSSVDSLNYKEVGFEVWYGEAASNPTKQNITAKFTTGNVLERIKAGVSYNYSPQVIDTSSKFFVTATIQGIQEKNLTQNFYIKAFCTPIGGTTEDRAYGVGRFFNVAEATAAENINIPVAMDTTTVGSELNNVTIAGKATTAKVAAYFDGYAHLNVKVPNDYADKTALPSASVVVVGEDKAVYRNLESKLKVTEGSGTVTGDRTWYDAVLEVDSDETEFVIANAADLYGFADVAKVSLKNKKFYLIADIDANDGKGTANQTGFVRSDSRIPYLWTPIGSSDAKFEGTFDGNMHTISGIYLDNSEIESNGLFGHLYGAAITNVKLENSYMTSTKQNLGSVAGSGFGDISNLYSEVHLKGSDAFEGGIIGRSLNGDTKITNCWFAGTIVNDYSAGVNTNGYVGGFIGYVANNSVNLQDCLYTGHIDVSNVKASSRLGNAGLVGVNHGTLNITDCAVLGTATRDTSKNYIYSYLGGGTCNTLDAYRVASDWDGNYSGTVTNDQRKDASGSVKGSAARTSMQELDWVNKWRAIDGNYPMQKVFADEYVDTDWYDVYKKDGQNYKLKDRQDLYGLAALVNAGVSFEGATIELSKDITVNTTDVLDWATTPPEYNWESIGTASNPFKGTIDGKKYSISGLYMNTTSDIAGLFGVVSGATVKNLELINSYMEAENNVGSIAGKGNGTFTSIYSDATIKTGYQFAGGIIGEANAATTLKKCWYAGTVINDDPDNVYKSGGFVGGMIGYVSAGKASLTDCYCSGFLDVRGMGTNSAYFKAGGFVGGVVGTLSLTNCVNVSGLKADNDSKPVYSTVGHFDNNVTASGVYSCNSKKDTECQPWPGGYSSSCGTLSYTGIDSSAIGAAAATKMSELDFKYTWQTTNGWPELLVFAEDYADTGWYEKEPYVITNRQELYGLAELVNAGENFEGKTIELANDITINTTDVSDFENTTPKYDWEPIGTASHPFKGTFDGKGYTISGLYMNTTSDIAGLFGVVSGATVENVKLTNSYIEAENHAGSIAGKGSGTFTGIYSEATINTGYQFGGGIIGETNVATTLNKCWFAGTVINNDSDNVYKSGGFVGGMIGYVSAGSASLTDCYCSGFLDVRGMGTNSAYFKAGGFVGGVAGTLSLTNCVNVSGLKADNGSKPVYSTVGHFDKNVTASGVYSCNGKKDTNCVAWPGGYNSSCGLLTYTSIDDSAKGAAAANVMTTLDFENTWETRTGWPILQGVRETTMLSSITECAQFQNVPKMVCENAQFSEAEDFGNGDWRIKVTGSTEEEYKNYLNLLESNGFEKHSDNGTDAMEGYA